MKKTFTYEHMHNDIPGSIIIEVMDIAPADINNQKSPRGRPMVPHLTLGSWRRRFETHVPLTNPYNGQQTLVDLTEWSHLDDNTFIRVDISFKPSVEIGIDDPRYPAKMREMLKERQRAQANEQEKPAE